MDQKTSPLGQRLRIARCDAGLTQLELADQIGVTTQAVSQWECGAKIPKRDNLLALSNILGISLSRLLQDLHGRAANDSLPGSVADRGGFEVPLIAQADVTHPNKDLVRKSIVSASFNCGQDSFALTVEDTACAPRYPVDTVLIFDPSQRAEPGDFVVAVCAAGHTVMGVLSLTGDAANPHRTITPLNPHWPPWREATVVAPLIEAHTRY